MSYLILPTTPGPWKRTLNLTWDNSLDFSFVRSWSIKHTYAMPGLLTCEVLKIGSF
jgi:hypothetical protein